MGMKRTQCLTDGERARIISCEGRSPPIAPSLDAWAPLPQEHSVGKRYSHGEVTGTSGRLDEKEEREEEAEKARATGERRKERTRKEKERNPWLAHSGIRLAFDATRNGAHWHTQYGLREAHKQAHLTPTRLDATRGRKALQCACVLCV